MTPHRYESLICVFTAKIVLRELAALGCPKMAALEIVDLLPPRPHCFWGNQCGDTMSGVQEVHPAAVQFSAVQCSSVQCSSVQFSSVQFSAVQCSEGV